MAIRGTEWRSIAIGVPLVLASWVAVALALPLFGQAGQRVAVFAPGGADNAFRAVIRAGGSLVDIRGGAVIAISDQPGFVARLYANGPLLVILADDRAGCGFGARRSSVADNDSAPAAGVTTPVSLR